MSASDATRGGSADLVQPSPVAPGRVAVVTGAASGIGLGLAERFAAEGMHVVLADVEEPALAKAAAGLAAAGASVLPAVTDVSDRAAVEALREAALSAFGAGTDAIATVCCPGGDCRSAATTRTPMMAPVATTTAAISNARGGPSRVSASTAPNPRGALRWRSGRSGCG